jgi:hypothetical protein
MVYITVFQAGNGEFGVMPSAEDDGDLAAIVHEFDPFQPLRRDGHAKRCGDRTGFPLPAPIVFGYTLQCAVVVVEGAPV